LAKIPNDTDGLKLISRETGVPAVDLTSLTLPLSILDVLTEETARALQILPLRMDDERLFVAIERPEDAKTLDELAFLSGRQVVAYAAHPDFLRSTIESAYLAKRRGQPVWYGPRAPRDLSDSIDVALRTNTPRTPLPVRPPFEQSSYVTPLPEPPAAKRQRPCVIVVDDEPVIRRLVQEALAQRGYEVHVAAGGVECLRLVKSVDPDAILLDAMLPDVHGFDICKRLKTSRRYQHIPVIMITAIYKGWRMAHDLRESYGVYAVLEKPFDVHRLVSLLEEALAGRPGGPSSPSGPSGEAQRLYQDSAEAYRAGDLDAAQAALAAAVAIDPLSPPLHHQLGLLYAQRGQDYAAIQELEAAVDLDPQRFQSLRNLAVLYQKHGFRRRACEIWERALAHAVDEPTRTEIRNILLKLL
jgi:DNA-binding response OmpR family regulator